MISLQSFIEILRDSVWQSLGAIAAFAALALTYWIHLAQRNTKELAFGRISSSIAALVPKETQDRIIATLGLQKSTTLNPLNHYGDDDTYLVVETFGIKNSGTVSILPRDFVQPLQMSFSGQPQILMASVVRQIPKNLGATVELENSIVKLVPLLLNPHDAVEIEIVATGGRRFLTTEFRINDIRTLARLVTRDDRVESAEALVFLCGMALVLAFGFTLGAIIEGDPVPSLSKWLFVFSSFTVPTTLIYRYRIKVGKESRRQMYDA